MPCSGSEMIMMMMIYRVHLLGKHISFKEIREEKRKTKYLVFVGKGPSHQNRGWNTPCVWDR